MNKSSEPTNGELAVKIESVSEILKIHNENIIKEIGVVKENVERSNTSRDEQIKKFEERLKPVEDDFKNYRLVISIFKWFGLTSSISIIGFIIGKFK